VRRSHSIDTDEFLPNFFLPSAEGRWPPKEVGGVTPP